MPLLNNPYLSYRGIIGHYFHSARDYNTSIGLETTRNTIATLYYLNILRLCNDTGPRSV